jgi:tripartite-type tricarboxylate transporter receptor subunit TctC
MRIPFMALLAVILLLGSAPAMPAETYPARPIKLIVPFAPGAGSDLMGRFAAQQLSERLGQTVIVENKPGAGSALGVDLVAKAKPDGYTLLWTASDGASIAPAVKSGLRYRIPDDFAFIARISDFPYIITVNPALPIHNLAEFLAYAKANPGKLRYGTAGIGSGSHLATELVSKAAGVELTHVPFGGIGPATQAAIGGHIEVIFGAPSIKAYTDAGKLRAIAMTGARRDPNFPDLPTLAEAGMPGVVVTIWWGMLAPAETPAPILARLREVTDEMMRDPKTAEGLRRIGYEPSYLPHDKFREFVLLDVQQWRSVARSANIKVED